MYDIFVSCSAFPIIPLTLGMSFLTALRVAVAAKAVILGTLPSISVILLS